MLPPLVSLAVSLLPNLAKRVADNVLPGVEQKLSDTVSEFLGTDDVIVAQEKLEDPKVAAELRVRLAEIEVEADKVEAQARAEQRQAELDAMKIELERFKSEIADTQDARSMLEGLTEKDSIFAWGPVIVSTIVVLGFFLVLRQLINGDITTGDPSVLQIVNIAVGALTAGFATVISFWLGSSQGSRKKDSNALISQTVNSDLQKQSSAATQRIVEDQGRQTAALLQRMVSAPQPRSAQDAGDGPRVKDARQFTRCMDIVLGHEGGFADHPEDPGGATNMGITHKTLAAWRGTAVTAEDVRNLSPEEARQIYRANYWNALNCDNLPAGVDLLVFDFGVNAGPRRSAMLLQKTVHVEQDGEIGTITVGAARAIDARHIINTFSDGRLEHYSKLPNWETFRNGWSKRTRETREAALEMSGSN